MTDYNARHKATKYVEGFMPDLLSSEDEEGMPKYDILMSLGESEDDWKNTVYQNNRTLNVFKGEPTTGTNEFNPFKFNTKGINWDITYTFKGIRNNKAPNGKYGSVISNDRLYYILVNAFNGGVDFVQQYLSVCAPARLEKEIREVVDPVIEALKENVLSVQQADEMLEQAVKDEALLREADKHRTKKGGYDMRYKSSKGAVEARQRLDAFLEMMESGNFTITDQKTKKKKNWKQEGERVAELLRNDFIQCMMIGEVPLSSGVLSEKTHKERVRVGLPAEPMFFATGHFAKSINFKVRVKT